MNFSEFIQKEAIITDLRAQTKEGVIQEMVDALAKTDKGVKKADVRGVVDSILRREELGSTGIGRSSYEARLRRQTGWRNCYLSGRRSRFRLVRRGGG